MKKWMTLAALAMLGCTAGRLQKEDPGSTAEMIKAASQINKSLPMMIDSETQLTMVLGSEKKFVYNHRFIHWTLDSALVGKISAMKPLMVNRTCSTPNTMNSFLKRGTVMEYQYYDKDFRYIATIDISLADCADTNRTPAAQKEASSWTVALNRASDRINKSLPMMIDSETQLTETFVAGEKIVYDCKLVHRTLNDSLPGKIAAWKPVMTKTNCSAPSIKDVFLNHGTTMEYRFYDRDGRYINTVDVSPADCADTNRTPDEGLKTEKPL